MKIPRICAGVRTCALACLLAGVASASTYYVSTSDGDDSRDGQTAAAAWKTIAKVNGSTFLAGDQILFKRGDVWRESLVPPSSGAAGNPIKFDAYGTGDPPTITGYQDLPLASWTLDSGNIWKASITSASFNYILFGGSIWGLKHTNGKSACVAPYDFYFASNVLYVYSVGPPTTYYGSVAAMLMTNGQLVYVNGKSWLEIQHFKLTYFDAYGLRIGGASDHITVANDYSDGIIPAGTTPHGFYVGTSAAITDLKFYDVDSHRNYNGLRVDAPSSGTASGIVVRNCRAYANRNHGLEDNVSGGSVDFDYCHFYGNGLAVVTSTDTVGGVAGSGTHDVAAYKQPLVQGFTRYPARITLTVDDPGLVANGDVYVDSILPAFDARGLQLGIAIVTGYNTSTSLIPKFQSWINAGRDVVSHSWSHEYFTFPSPDPTPRAFTIHYTGTGTAATVTISGNHLTTSVTGGPGGENMDLDLTNPSYDTISELVATITGRGVYSAAMDPRAMGAAHSIGISDASGQDIKGATYTAVFQESRLEPDELSTSKAWMTANLTGLPSTRVFVYPDGLEDSQTQGWAVAAGYAGARGAFTMDLGTKDVYGRGVNVQNITSFGANPSLQGLSATDMDARMAMLVFKSSVWGAPYGLFWHYNEMPVTEVGNLLDGLINHGATIMTNTQLVSWLGGQSLVAGTTTYVSPATGADANFRPTAAFPTVNSGADLGSEFKYDLLGVDQSWMGSAWEMGSYALVPATGPWVLVVR